MNRPAIANKRLKLNSTTDVVLQLKSPCEDGTTHIANLPREPVTTFDHRFLLASL